MTVSYNDFLAAREQLPDAGGFTPVGEAFV